MRTEVRNANAEGVRDSKAVGCPPIVVALDKSLERLFREWRGLITEEDLAR